MFNLVDTPFKFFGLLLLFTWCTAWGIYELTRPQDVRQRVSNTLHLVMAVVMLVMVSPLTWKALIAVIPTFALAAAFVVATAWFVWLAAAQRRTGPGRGWLHFAGHAAMFAAMAWHLGAMGVMAAARAGGGMGTGGMGGHQPAATSPIMMAFAIVGVPLMAYLFGASVRSLWLTTRPAVPGATSTCPCGPGCDCSPDCSCYATHAHAAALEPELVAAGSAPTPQVAATPVVSTQTCHEVRPVGTTKFRLESLAGFAMSFGMFWMSTGIMVPLLPFFAALAF